MKLIDKMKLMGYEPYEPEKFNNCFHSEWRVKGVTKSIVFDYHNRTCTGYITCVRLMGNRADLDELNICYSDLEKDLTELRNCGIETVYREKNI